MLSVVSLECPESLESLESLVSLVSLECQESLECPEQEEVRNFNVEVWYSALAEAMYLT